MQANFQSPINQTNIQYALQKSKYTPWLHFVISKKYLGALGGQASKMTFH